jgi:hypothetical protein
MQTSTQFTVLIERRRLRQVALGTLFLLGALALSLPALADSPQQKIASDLQKGMSPVRLSQDRWSRDVGGVRQVQVIVVSDGKQGDLADLRAAVVRLGGSVHARHPAVNGLTVQLPADKVAQLAQRADVLGISPNRHVTRSASTLEAVTGSLTGNVRSYLLGSTYSGVDGRRRHRRARLRRDVAAPQLPGRRRLLARGAQREHAQRRAVGLAGRCRQHAVAGAGQRRAAGLRKRAAEHHLDPGPLRPRHARRFGGGRPGGLPAARQQWRRAGREAVRREGARQRRSAR